MAKRRKKPAAKTGSKKPDRLWIGAIVVAVIVLVLIWRRLIY